MAKIKVMLEELMFTVTRFLQYFKMQIQDAMNFVAARKYCLERERSIYDLDVFLNKADDWAKV